MVDELLDEAEEAEEKEDKDADEKQNIGSRRPQQHETICSDLEMENKHQLTGDDDIVVREEFSATTIVDEPEDEIKRLCEADLPISREAILNQLILTDRETNRKSKSLKKKLDSQMSKDKDPSAAGFHNNSVHSSQQKLDPFADVNVNGAATHKDNDESVHVLEQEANCK